MSAPTARRKYPTDCTSRATASPVIVSSWAIRTRTGGGSVAMGTVKQMDLDALTAARRQEWARLDELSRARRLSSSKSEEHTSELQSLMRISYAVFCLKKKKKNK